MNKILINEIIEYLDYDKILSSKEKKEFISLIKNKKEISNSWMKTIYDYFDSHILSDGSIVSLEVKRLEESGYNDSYYDKVQEEFINELFKNNKPLYFLDVDNTLTDLGVLSDEKKEFISNWENKERVILSTGKNYSSIYNTAKDCGITQNYASAINGSVLYYNNKYESVNKLGSISKKIVKELLNTKLTIITYYNENIHLVMDLNEEVVSLLKKYDEYNIDSTKETDYSKVVKILAFIYDKDKESEKIVDDIVSKYKDLVSVRTSWHTYEILRRDQHKGNTVKEISKRLGYYYRCSIGVGDSMNDLPMLNYCGLPFVVSTASDEMKSYKFKELNENRKIDIVELMKKYN